MRKSVDISTQKTIARLSEFKGDPVKLTEVMTTLSNLNRLSKLLDDVELNNVNILEDKDK